MLGNKKTNNGVDPNIDRCIIPMLFASFVIPCFSEFSTIKSVQDRVSRNENKFDIAEMWIISVDFQGGLLLIM